MKNKFSQAIVLSMVTLSSMAFLTACSSHKESSSADKTPKSSQVTSSSRVKSSNKDSGKTSKPSAKVKESSGSNTESSSAPSSKKSSAPSSSSSQTQSSSSNSSSVPSSSQSQAPKSSNESQSSASQSQAPKSSSDSQASSSQSSSQAQAKTDMQVTTVDMDVSAVARGQFDSIAGTWKSSDGSRVVLLVGDITAQGQATVHNYVHPKDDYQEGSGKYDATLSRDRGDTSGIVGDISFVSKKAAISGPSYEQDTIQVTSTGGTKVYLKESDNMTLPKDVTVTDNQLPIDGGIAESGSYKLTKRTAVKNTPSDKAPVEFYLEAGDQINFDMKVIQDGHSWISYISYSGVRRYVQVD